MKSRDLAYIALFAAIIAVLGPAARRSTARLRVPITAQTLGVMLAGVGARRTPGALALLTFLVVVAVGLPVLVRRPRRAGRLHRPHAPGSSSAGRSPRSSSAC